MYVMNTHKKMHRITFIAVILLCATALHAQVVDSAHLLIQYVPKLTNATKINDQAVIDDTLKEEVTYSYEISPQKPELNFNPAEIKVSKLNPEVRDVLYRNYIKLGFGYPITPLAELSMHNCQNTKYSYGLNFHHFSSWAQPIGKEQQQYAYAPTSDTRLHLFLNRFFRTQTLYSSVGYNHELANLYGYNRNWGIPEQYYAKEYRDSIHNNFNHVYGEVGIRSNYTTEDKKFKEDVKIKYDFIHTYWKDMEHDAGLRAILAYDDRFLKISGYQHYQFDIDFDFYHNHWGDSVLIGTHEQRRVPRLTNSFKVEFRPTMHFTIKEYHLLLGVGVPVLMSNSKTYCPVYPIAELQMGLVRGILSLYAGVDGKSEYNSLRSLLYENPYVKPQLDSLKFTRSQISIYGGVKGNIVKKLNYHISARYAYVKDYPFFILDTRSPLKNQFDVMYADKGSTLNVCANLSWEAINHLYLNLTANYWDFFFLHIDVPGIGHLEKPLYKPNWGIGFEGKYILKEKFIFDVNASIAFGRWALSPVTATDSLGNTFISGYELVNDLKKNSDGKKLMKPILNFGIGFEYLITKQLTAFAMVNNIGCQYASTYYNFNNFGINALVGVSYSFGNEPLKPAKKKKSAPVQAGQ